MSTDIFNRDYVFYFLTLFCRGGKQIDFLGLNENYNFELQEIVNVGSIKTIKQVWHNIYRNTAIFRSVVIY